MYCAIAHRSIRGTGQLRRKNKMEWKNKPALNLNAIIVLFALIIAFAGIGCKKSESDTRSYNFTVTRDGSALANATVTIATDGQDFSATTDADGKCQINIPNSISLPQYTIVTVDKTTIRPYALTVSGSNNIKINSSVSCQSVPSLVLGKWVKLHHIGDNHFQGSNNSQLQLQSEGLYTDYHFTLGSVPSSMPHLQIFARGVSQADAILINGHGTANLGTSATNGDLSNYNIQLQTGGVALNQIFHIGDNVLTIHTGHDSNNDWDDIEFCGLILYY